MLYTVIIRNADGEVSVAAVPAADLIDRLATQYYGDVEWQSKVSDPQAWPGDIAGVIIDGGPISPANIPSLFSAGECPC